MYIKGEPEVTASSVKTEPEMMSLVVTENRFNGANYSMNEIDIKEEPLEVDEVSELLNR